MKELDVFFPQTVHFAVTLKDLMGERTEESRLGRFNFIEVPEGEVRIHGT